MRIHTDTLTRQDLYAATRHAGEAHLEECDEHGSRSRKRSYDVGLAVYDGGKGTSHPYRRNTGQYGAEGGAIWAATYDEWGWWLAALFELDPLMIAGVYKGYDDFHAKTSHKYRRAA